MVVVSTLNRVVRISRDKFFGFVEFSSRIWAKKIGKEAVGRGINWGFSPPHSLAQGGEGGSDAVLSL